MIRTLISVSTLVALPSFASAQCAEGCTPGYWRNHPERWDGAGSDDYTQTVKTFQSLNAVMGVTSAESGRDNAFTLYDATNKTGGLLNQLNFHAAAALASADSGICYPFTVGQVIDIYRDGVGAIPGPLEVESAKDTLAGANELGCPLSNDPPPPPPFTPFCIADQGDCPCGNDGTVAGCLNSTGLGARLDAVGSSSLAADDLMLIATQLPANETTLFLMSQGVQRRVLNDGLLCIGGPGFKLCRLLPTSTSSAEGTASFGPGFLQGAVQYGELCVVSPGETWNFQVYFRDLDSLCGFNAGLSNAIGVTITQ